MSSCPCSLVPNSKISCELSKTGDPTNLSVRDCDYDKFTCSNTLPFKYGEEPDYSVNLMVQESPKYYNNLNPSVVNNPFLTQKRVPVGNPQERFGVFYDPQFVGVNCPPNSLLGRGGCNRVYASHDPRLLDTPRNVETLLDRPPLWKDVPLKNIYSEKLRNYGQKYRSYNDISAGQVVYYTDASIKDAYFSPNFTIRSDVESNVYSDPMENLKPHYPREPIVVPEPGVWSNSVNNYGPLTWINDSAYHRENIMASQMAKRNQERWMPRWN